MEKSYRVTVLHEPIPPMPRTNDGYIRTARRCRFMRMAMRQQRPTSPGTTFMRTSLSVAISSRTPEGLKCHRNQRKLILDSRIRWTFQRCQGEATENER